jgi:hypothetical protein
VPKVEEKKKTDYSKLETAQPLAAEPASLIEQET